MSGKIKLMGILNVTPDSFYDSGKFYDEKMAIDRAYEIAEEGADMIDIGGESTRPGANPVTASQEIDRVCPVIEAINKDIGISISIDTNKSDVAEAALRSGAAIVNDISGLTFDGEMAAAVAKHNAGVVLMHIQGKPQDMQENPQYDELISDIYKFLKRSINVAINAGIDNEKIIIDPGIGFGKTLEDNYRIINDIPVFKNLGFQVLIGLSRKSLIGKIYNDDSDRLPATIALNIVSIQNGADIIRVHDVKEHKLALRCLEFLKDVS